MYALNYNVFPVVDNTSMANYNITLPHKTITNNT